MLRQRVQVTKNVKNITIWQHFWTKTRQGVVHSFNFFAKKRAAYTQRFGAIRQLLNPGHASPAR